MTAVAGTGTHLPAWTAAVAWTALGIGLACGLWTLLDVVRRPPSMPVMRAWAVVDRTNATRRWSLPRSST